MDSLYIQKQIEYIFKREQEKYKENNPCPMCGSHNVDYDLNWINGKDSRWVEWCNDCGWKKEHNTKEVN